MGEGQGYFIFPAWFFQQSFLSGPLEVRGMVTLSRGREYGHPVLGGRQLAHGPPPMNRNTSVETLSSPVLRI